jgi:hypothetical protein
MKKLVLSLLFISLLSCSGDSEIIPDNTSGDIHGVWKLNAEYNNGVRQGLSECRLQENMAFEDNSIIMIKTDESSGANCSLSTIQGTFSKADNTLSIVFPNENIKFKIKELTTVKLVLIPENSLKTFEYTKAK